MVEDVGAFVDGEGGAHLAEHVVLGFAWGLLGMVDLGHLDIWPWRGLGYWGAESHDLDLIACVRCV